MEHIVKAASHSSRIPLREKEAAREMVPYMHSGEAIPSTLAGTTPSRPIRLWPMRRNSPWIFSFRKTVTQEPSTMPSTQ